MLTSDRFEPRPAEKSKRAEASQISSVEAIGARLRVLREQYDALDGANWAIGRLPEDTARRPEYDHKSYIKAAQDRIAHEREILAHALSTETPVSVRDALIMLVVCFSRLDRSVTTAEAALLGWRIRECQ
jgi:hypothetical protein